MRIGWAVVMISLVPWSAFGQGAQDPDRQSHFGVIGTFAPESKFREAFEVLFDANRVDVRSRDFEIGFIVRGRQLGGDWGVSYIQKGYKDGSVIDNTENFCNASGCFDLGSRETFQNVELRGISIHKFAPFVTIKRRAQIGMTFGGGAGQVRGQAESHRSSLFSSQGPPTESRTTIDAKELFFEGYDWIPIWKLEVTGAVLVAPGLKVRVGAGLNFTNYTAASVSATYLFGSR